MCPAEDFPLLNDPVLAASPAPGSLLSLLLVFDEWLIFPRTPLLRLLPAMTGLQQLLYAYAGKQCLCAVSVAQLLSLCTVGHDVRLHPQAAVVTDRVSVQQGSLHNCMLQQHCS